MARVGWGRVARAVGAFSHHFRESARARAALATSIDRVTTSATCAALQTAVPTFLSLRACASLCVSAFSLRVLLSACRPLGRRFSLCVLAGPKATRATSVSSSRCVLLCALRSARPVLGLSLAQLSSLCPSVCPPACPSLCVSSLSHEQLSSLCFSHEQLSSLSRLHNSALSLSFCPSLSLAQLCSLSLSLSLSPLAAQLRVPRALLLEPSNIRPRGHR